MWVFVLLDYAGAALFVASLFALRQTVMAMIQGGRDTFSLFRNLRDREQVSCKEELSFYWRAVSTTFRPFQGPERVGGAPGYGTGRTNEFKLVEAVKKYRDAEPVDHDAILYGIRSVGWGRLTMAAALGAFVCRLAALIVRPFVGA